MSTFIDYAPAISLIFFFSVFLWVTYWAYRPSAKQQLQAYAFIPLAEDNINE